MIPDEPAPGAILEPEPHSWPWAFFCLFLRPTEFFRDYVLRPIPLLTLIAAWTYGIAAVMDSVDRQILRSEMGGQNVPWDRPLQSWSAYWLVCLAGGAVSAVFYYYLGGWWYRVRLRWSGAERPPPWLARRVYLFAAQAFSIPAILYAGWQTLAYDSPRAAFSAENLVGSLLLLVCLAWSLVVSYRGVRILFSVRRWAARLWFVILPAGTYTVAIGALFAMGLFASYLDRPQLRDPWTASEPMYQFKYPGNWNLERETRLQEATAEFSVGPWVADAIVRFWIYPFPVDPEAEVLITRENLAESFEILAARPLERWGAHEGNGFSYDALIDGSPYRVISFCASTDEAGFEILQVVEEGAEHTLEPGFALIRDTFVLKPPR